MKQRPRRYFTEPEILSMWERWHSGESLHSIARDLDHGHSAVQGALARSGGLRPVQRRRSRLALSLAEREEISRGIVVGHSIRAIAASLGRAPSTVSRKLRRNWAGYATGHTRQIKPLGTGLNAGRSVNWLPTVRWHASLPVSLSSSGRRIRSLAG